MQHRIKKNILRNIDEHLNKKYGLSPGQLFMCEEYWEDRARAVAFLDKSIKLVLESKIFEEANLKSPNKPVNEKLKKSININHAGKVKMVEHSAKSGKTRKYYKKEKTNSPAQPA